LGAKHFFQKSAESLRIQYQPRFAGGSILGSSGAIMLGRLVRWLQLVPLILIAVVLVAYSIGDASGPENYGDHLTNA
jgi:hypothetical protein